MRQFLLRAAALASHQDDRDQALSLFPEQPSELDDGLLEASEVVRRTCREPASGANALIIRCGPDCPSPTLLRKSEIIALRDSHSISSVKTSHNLWLAIHALRGALQAEVAKARREQKIAKAAETAA